MQPMRVRGEKRTETRACGPVFGLQGNRGLGESGEERVLRTEDVVTGGGLRPMGPSAAAEDFVLTGQ